MQYSFSIMWRWMVRSNTYINNLETRLESDAYLVLHRGAGKGPVQGMQAISEGHGKLLWGSGTPAEAWRVNSSLTEPGKRTSQCLYLTKGMSQSQEILSRSWAQWTGEVESRRWHRDVQGAAKASWSHNAIPKHLSEGNRTSFPTRWWAIKGFQEDRYD